MDTFDHVAEQRRALVDRLEGLDEEQWRTPSLCEGWEARHVAGHLNIAWAVSPLRLVGSIVRHRGYNRANLTLSRELGERPKAELLEGLRTNATVKTRPPGTPPEGVLADVLIHAQDILIPLGTGFDAPDEALGLILGYLTSKKGKMLNPSGGIEGLTYRATDLDWSWGDGPEVTGRAFDLAVALAARASVVERLTGDGVATFAARF